jgi:hypothetical protein
MGFDGGDATRDEHTTAIIIGYIMKEKFGFGMEGGG